MINFTLRIGWPQLELGGWASSPIRTAGATATRAADVVSLVGPPAFGGEYTLHASATPSQPDTANEQAIINVSDGSEANSWLVYRWQGGVYALGWAAGAYFADLSGGAMATGAASRVAAGYRVGSQGISTNGGAVAGDTGTLAPSGLNSVRIGANPSGAGQFFGGYIQRIAIWPSNRISDAGLQALTGLI